MTDFDGTLAPIVGDPATARPLAGAAAVVADLAGTFEVVAVVSGRPASFLAEHLRLPGAAVGRRAPQLVGLYGLERVSPHGEVTLDPAVAPWLALLGEATERLTVGSPPGVLVEPKGAAVTVHWRGAPDTERWVRRATAAEAARTGLHTFPGRMSIELRPPLEVDKGTVVTGLVSGCAAACYFGDDLGDLPAFDALAALGGGGRVRTVSVAVVDDESPPEVAAAADLSVRGPEEALGLLRWLADSAARGTSS